MSSKRGVQNNRVCTQKATVYKINRGVKITRRVLKLRGVQHNAACPEKRSKQKTPRARTKARGSNEPAECRITTGVQNHTACTKTTAVCKQPLNCRKIARCTKSPLKCHTKPLKRTQSRVTPHVLKNALRPRQPRNREQS